ncbi:MAG: GIY-YIG nuclease family protein [Cyanobacteria bacterium P01_G01_bin.39]
MRWYRYFLGYACQTCPENWRRSHYLIQGDGYFKIGKTTNLSIRSQQISLQLPFKVTLVHSISTNNIDEAERYWHTKFKSKRLNGEWFALVEGDVAEFLSIREM